MMRECHNASKIPRKHGPTVGVIVWDTVPPDPLSEAEKQPLLKDMTPNGE